MIWPLPTFRALVLTVQPFNPLHPCTSQTCHIPDHRPFAQSVLSAWTVLPILFDIQQTYMLRVYILRNLQHPQELGVNMITPILEGEAEAESGLTLHCPVQHPLNIHGSQVLEMQLI